MKRIYLIPILSILSAMALGATIKHSITVTNFNSGELSPQMEGRVDFEKYPSGARELQNMIVRSQGPVTRRPGTKFIAEVKDSNNPARLVPFEYSTNDAYILELGHEYLRLYRNGAQVLDGNDPYEVNSPWDANDIFEIQFAQDAQVMRLVHPDYHPYQLVRNSASHTDWTLAEVTFVGGPFLDENEEENDTITPSATTGDVNLAANSGPFDANHVGALWQVTHLVDSNDIAGRFWGAWTVVSGDVDSEAVDGTESGISTYETNSVSIRVWENQEYTVTTGGDWFGTFKIQRSYDANTWNTVKSFSYRGNGNVLYSGIEREDDAYYRVRIENQYVTSHMEDHGEGECDWTFATDSFFRHGVVKITDYTDANNVEGTVQTELASTDATYRWAEGVWSTYRGWPRTIEHHEQRCFYGGSESWPQTIWSSVTSSQDSDYDDFDPGVGDAADAMTYVLPGMSPIQWMVSAEYLMVGTTEGVGRLGSPDKVMSPDWPPTYRLQARNGCAYQDAMPAGDAILYVERGEQKIREVTYTYAEDRYVAPDMTILAEHIGREGIVQIDFAERPDPILWCVRGDGQLLSFTYQRKQEVLAWGRHITGQDPNDMNDWDDFESVAIIPGTSNRADGTARNDDEVWVVVKREVDSNDVRYVEQFQSLDWGNDPNYCWFVDCGLGSYSGGDLTAAAGSTVYSYPTLQALTAGEIPTAPAEPSVTTATVAVSNAGGLQAMTGSGKYYLTADIDLTGVTWTPITNFSGVLDGRGYTISNLSIDAATSDYQGLFGTVSAGFQCYDLTLDNCTVVGKDYTAILVAMTNSSATFVVKDVNFTDCSVTGGICVGTMFGMANSFLSGTIYNCDATTCTMTANQYCGVLLGYMDPSGSSTGDFNVVNCDVTGSLTVTGEGEYCGGFIGYVSYGKTTATASKVVFHTCTTSASVTNTDGTSTMIGIGGFAGYMMDEVNLTTSTFAITSCSATGAVSITGDASLSILAGVGGFTGFTTNVTYTNCHTTGAITIDVSAGGDLQLIGGFVGKWDVDYPEQTLRCYATGDITVTMGSNTAWEGIGGFVGGYLGTSGTYEGGVISRCWTESDITLTSDAQPVANYGGGLGGFIGYIATLGSSNTVRGNSVTNCYAWGSIVLTAEGDEPTYVARTSVGGFLGSQYDAATNPTITTFTNCYCAQTNSKWGSGLTGQIPTRDKSSGFAGDDVDTAAALVATASYFDQETSSHSTDTYATNHTTDWLQTQSNFSAWNFTTTWVIDSQAGATDPNSWSGATQAGGLVECVYADCRPIGTFTVDANGVLDLEAEYSIVIAGLNYFSILETMPLVDPQTIGRPTSIKNVAIDFYESMGANVGSDFDHSSAWKFFARNYLYGPARDPNDGTVALPYQGDTMATGDVVRIYGTTNYNGIWTLAADTNNVELRISETFTAETFDGTETVDPNESIEPYTGYKPLMGYAPFVRGMTRQPVIYTWVWEPIPLTIRSITANMEITAE